MPAKTAGINWKARLGKIKNFKKAKEEAAELGTSFEDGRYKARITEAKLAESQSSGREQINLPFEILDGEYQGQKGFTSLGLDDKSLRFSLAAIEKMGYDLPEEAEEIVDTVNDINNDQPEVVIQVKNGFSNIVGKVEAEDEIGGGSDEDEGGEEGEEEAEEGEESEEEESGDDAEVSIGSKVSFTWKGEEMTGEVVEIREKEGKIVVRTDDKKKYPVKAENASLVQETEESEEEETEEEEEEAPAKKKASKPVAKKKVTRKK